MTYEMYLEAMAADANYDYNVIDIMDEMEFYTMTGDLPEMIEDLMRDF